MVLVSDPELVCIFHECLSHHPKNHNILSEGVILKYDDGSILPRPIPRFSINAAS